MTPRELAMVEHLEAHMDRGYVTINRHEIGVQVRHAKDVEGGFGWSREEINRSEQSVAEMVAHAAERLENKLAQKERSKS